MALPITRVLDAPRLRGGAVIKRMSNGLAVKVEASESDNVIDPMFYNGILA
jgi:hypothetical protein